MKINLEAQLFELKQLGMKRETRVISISKILSPTKKLKALCLSCLLRTVSKNILQEIEKFYSDLYKNDFLTAPENLLNGYLKNPDTYQDSPKLMLKLKEGKLVLDEYLRSIQLFENKRPSSDDDLSGEFDKVFWDILGNLIVESLSFSYDHGELSNLQKREELETNIAY